MQALGYTPKGRTTTHATLRRVLRRGFSDLTRALHKVLRRVLRRGGFAMGLTVKRGSEKGSQKGFLEGAVITFGLNGMTYV